MHFGGYCSTHYSGNAKLRQDFEKEVEGQKSFIRNTVKQLVFVCSYVIIIVIMIMSAEQSFPF